MSDTILVPTDGSAESERALDIAIPLAKALNLSITLFWCWEGLPDFEGTFPDEFTEQITTREMADRAAAADRLAHARLTPEGIAHEIESAVGHPAEQLLDLIESTRPRLVAISTHGRSGFKRWRLGSIADRVVRHALADTVIVAPQDETPLRDRIAKIVVPLDGSERAERALDDAATIARATGASLLLVRAYLLVIATTPMGLDVAYTQANEAALAGADAYLAGVGEQLGDLTVEKAVFNGEASQAIIDAAADADLIVMASHGRGGLKRLALGSVTDAVIRGSHKPVLVDRVD